jgi:hypothetical protein
MLLVHIALPIDGRARHIPKFAAEEFKLSRFWDAGSKRRPGISMPPVLRQSSPREIKTPSNQPCEPDQ